MTQPDSRYLDAFPQWLSTLASDVATVSETLEQELPVEVQRRLFAALNYLLKSIDLIPDGVQDLGYLDSAFFLRVSCQLALKQGTLPERAASLAAEYEVIQSFLGADAERLERYVAQLDELEVRGRSVEQLLASEEQRVEVLEEIRSWVNSYQVPSFSRDETNLVKLRAFLGARLPS